MLELIDISFSVGKKKILDNINLKLDINRFIAITGPNGSGKSTLGKIIMGIEQPTKGIVKFKGKDITKLNITERSKLGIAFAFQQPVKFKGFKVEDLIDISAENKEKKQNTCKYLSDVGLCPNIYKKREIDSSLSGGELKRIEIATVLARDADLTIFDEPEAGIDLWSFEGLIKVFKKMQKKTNKTIVVISHQEKILEIADEIILLNKGKIIAVR